MIDPSGHAKNVGRKLVESYERGETFKFAQELQKKLQQKYKIRPILTRFPGEEILDLQNASFSNRLGVDFYISLHIYREESVRPKIFLYHLIYDPLVDLASRIIDPFYFVSIYQSHFRNIHTTRFFASNMKNVLTLSKYQKNFNLYGLYGLPIKPLCGIIAPAIAIEVGIYQEDQWKTLVDPIVESLSFLDSD